MTGAAAPSPVTADQDVEGDEDAMAGDGRGRGRRAENAFLLIGFLVLAGFVIGTRWGVFTPDTRPDLYERPGRFVAESLQAWVRGPLGLGQSNFNAGAAPVGVVIWVIRALGAPTWLAVRIWRLLLLVVAAWGIRRYLSVLLGGSVTPWARTAATVFWVANPYVIVAGNTTPILLPYALLPWMMGAFLQAGRRGGWRWPAVFALGFFAQGGLNAGVVSFFQLLALPAHLLYLGRAERVPLRRLLGALARCGLLSILVSLYWLAPSFLASGTGAAIASSTEEPADIARTSSYAEAARGLGHWALYGRSGDRLFLGGYTVYLTNRLVLTATFVVVACVAAALQIARSRARLLAVGLLATALPIMVGLFPGDAPSPAGRLLDGLFRAVPATLAFRTTNKVGSVAVLGMTIALAVGVIDLGCRLVAAPRRRRVGAVLVVGIVLMGAATPLWNGSLYPLAYEVPPRWVEATAELDAEGDGRVLVVPGGTGGNYRWGLRSPDDLFPSHLRRPVVSRNTVVGAADPAGNLLTWFDTELQQETLPADGVSVLARYLGADRVVNRNDVLSEETDGARPSAIAATVAADPGLELLRTHGRPGTDTVPEHSGPLTDDAASQAPTDAALSPIEVYEVLDPIAEVNLADPADLVLVDGDGAAFGPLIDLGILGDSPPVRYVGDLDAAQLTEALAGGARLVLTDTNQRRAWDINRLRNASTSVLRPDESLEQGTGPSITLWPERTERQTVADLGPWIEAIDADFERFGVRPWGKPTAAIDGNEYTGFLAGGIVDPVGGSLRIRLSEATEIDRLAIKIGRTEPARITALDIELGGETVTLRTDTGDEWFPLSFDGIETDELTVTVTEITPGLNPVQIDEIVINGGSIRAFDRLRTPRTIPAMLERADDGARDRLAEQLDEAPIDIVLTRLVGWADHATDDEEAVMNRIFELPVTRTMTFEAQLAAGEIEPGILAEARGGDAACRTVAEIDGDPVRARIVDIDGRGRWAPVRLLGCDPLTLGTGVHELTSVFGWRIDRVHLRDGRVPDAPTATAIDLGSTEDGRSLRIPPGDGPRYLRTGIGFDPRWQLEIDGVDQGSPLLLDGHALGWLIGPEEGEMRLSPPTQGTVELMGVLTAIGVVGVTAVAVAPSLPPLARRRPDGDESSGDRGEGR